jgi:hypothetical protein
MPMRHWISLTPSATFVPAIINDEEEEGGDYLFDPEAGKANDNPFAHQTQEALDETVSDQTEVSKYDGGESE